jgi:hypothetical protein
MQGVVLIGPVATESLSWWLPHSRRRSPHPNWLRRSVTSNSSSTTPSSYGLNVPFPGMTRSSEVKAILAMAGTSILWADHSTIWALRHRTTEPDPRRTIERRFRPSSLVMSRAATRSAMPLLCASRRSKWWTRPTNVDGYGTSRLPVPAVVQFLRSPDSKSDLYEVVARAAQSGKGWFATRAEHMQVRQTKCVEIFSLGLR